MLFQELVLLFLLCFTRHAGSEAPFRSNSVLKVRSSAHRWMTVCRIAPLARLIRKSNESCMDRNDAQYMEDVIILASMMLGQDRTGHHEAGSDGCSWNQMP